MQIQTVKQISQELKAKRPELASRIERAAEILATRNVDRIGQNLYRVESQSRPGHHHIVTLGPRTCGCYDWLNNRAPENFCKHIIAVCIMVRAEEYEARGETLATAS